MRQSREPRWLSLLLEPQTGPPPPHFTGSLQSVNCSSQLLANATWVVLENGKGIRQGPLGDSLGGRRFSLPQWAELVIFGTLTNCLQMFRCYWDWSSKGFLPVPTHGWLFCVFLCLKEASRVCAWLRCPSEQPVVNVFYLREGFIYFRLVSSLVCYWRWTWPSDSPASTA